MTPCAAGAPFPRLVIAAPRSGEGKTTVFTALAALFRRRNLAVRAFKVGPDFIDSGRHAALTKAPCRNLDSVLMPRAAIADTLRRGGAPHGLNLIEGVMGLFDGLGAGETGSTAETARLLEAPVLLCLRAGGFSRSAAALVCGFRDFSPGLNLAGVILTDVSSEAHYALLKEIIETQAGPPCFGFIPRHPDLVVQSRHLGLLPAEEDPDLPARAELLADLARLDPDGLWTLARSAPPPPSFPLDGRPGAIPADTATGAPPKAPGAAPPDIPPNTLDDAPGAFPPAAPAARSALRPPAVRLGLARDAAFSFYYQDNLDLLEALGAELVPFSPLRDPALPARLDGLYLGGGFPELFAAELAANRAFLSSLRAALEHGLPCLAECGGMFPLCRGLTDAAGARREMSGFFPAEAIMTAALQRPFGYVEAEQAAPTPLGPAGLRFLAHEFHYSRLAIVADGEAAEDSGAAGAFHPAPLRVGKPGAAPAPAGMLRGNCLGLYPHLHFAGMPEAARHFLDCCRDHNRPGRERPDHDGRGDRANGGHR